MSRISYTALHEGTPISKKLAKCYIGANKAGVLALELLTLILERKYGKAGEDCLYDKFSYNEQGMEEG